MKRLQNIIIVALLVLSSTASVVIAEDAAEIMKRSHLAYYYAADDGVAEVTMTLINKKGKERLRVFTMLRLDLEEGGRQSYYTYFRKPSDVARLTFMVQKEPEGNDRRLIYVPAVDLIKPISSDDKNSSFVGSDFSYEDISGRHWTEDNHTMLKDTELNGKQVYLIESIPKEKYKGFARKLTYIDKTIFLPLKEEYFDKKDKMIKRFTAIDIKEVDGFQTITKRSMENLKKKSKTVVEFSSIKYNAGVTEDLFSERYLKNPPRKYIK